MGMFSPHIASIIMMYKCVLTIRLDTTWSMSYLNTRDVCKPYFIACLHIKNVIN